MLRVTPLTAIGTCSRASLRMCPSLECHTSIEAMEGFRYWEVFFVAEACADLYAGLKLWGDWLICGSTTWKALRFLTWKAFELSENSI